MSYSDFSLEKVKRTFELTTSETVDLFGDIPELECSALLTDSPLYIMHLWHLPATAKKRDRSSANLISRFVYKEVNSNLIYPENEVDLVFVELPKFTKQKEQLETLTDKWIYFMKAAHEAREEGKEEGREEGMREKAIEIARQLLARLDETISQITGLSIEEIGNLRSNQI